MIAAAETASERPLLDFVVARIAAAPLEERPFGHIRLEEVFPESFYRDLLAHLPATELYDEQHHKDAMLPSGKSARLRFELERENVARLPERQRAFWLAFLDQFDSNDLERALKRKFEPVLRRRFGTDPERIRVRRRLVLFKDVGGYKISIHPDNADKVITCQVYLPADETQLHLGTAFHEHLGDDQFRKAESLPFRPNSGYAFAVTEHSWHSVEPLTGGDRERNTLMAIFYQEGGLQRITTTLRNALRAVKKR
jgi:hypothetical protein